MKFAVVPSPFHYHPSAIEPWLEDAFSSFSSFSASASSVLRAAAFVVFSVLRHFWTSLRAYSSSCASAAWCVSSLQGTGLTSSRVEGPAGLA